MPEEIDGGPSLRDRLFTHSAGVAPLLDKVECLPGDIPEHIDVDVTSLKIGDHIKMSDLPESDRYRVLSDAGQTLVVCIPPAKEEPAETAAEVEGEVNA